MQKIKYISAPNFVDIKDNENVVFLAGPIQGALGWHEEAHKIFIEEYNKLDTDLQITIFSPKRETGIEKNFTQYDVQVEWETLYLKKSGEQGVVLFWFANEKEKVYLKDGSLRPFGKTSRSEYGEWKARHDILGCDVVLGLDTDWQKEKYFRTRIEQDGSDIPICSTLRETIQETLNKIIK